MILAFTLLSFLQLYLQLRCRGRLALLIVNVGSGRFAVKESVSRPTNLALRIAMVIMVTVPLSIQILSRC